MLRMIAIIMVVLLIIANHFGSRAKKEKIVSNWLVIARICFFVLLTVAIVHFILTLSTYWWLKLIGIIYLILVDILMETNFRLKRETFGDPNRAYGVTAALVVALLVIIGWF